MCPIGDKKTLVWGNGLVPDGTKPLPQRNVVLAKIYGTIQCY